MTESDREQVPIHGVVSMHDADEREPIHVHELEGQLKWPRAVAIVRTAQGTFVLPATHALWVPPGVPHGGIYPEAVEEHSLYVSASACKELPACACAVEVTDPLRSVLEQQTLTKPGLWSPSTIELLRNEVRDAKHAPLSLSLPAASSVKPVVEALFANPSNALTLEQWARVLDTSPSTLARAFRRDTQLSFGDWRTQVRLLHALRHLASGMSVAEVAHTLGYQPSAFIQVFRRVLGATPAKYFRRS